METGGKTPLFIGMCVVYLCKKLIGWTRLIDDMNRPTTVIQSIPYFHTYQVASVRWNLLDAPIERRQKIS